MKVQNNVGLWGVNKIWFKSLHYICNALKPSYCLLGKAVSVKKKAAMRPATLTIWRLLFVHQVEGIPPWSLGQIQSLSYLSEGPAQMSSVADSPARLHSEPLIT